MKSLKTRKKTLFFLLLTFLRAWRRLIAGGDFFCTGKNMKGGNETGIYQNENVILFPIKCYFCIMRFGCAACIMLNVYCEHHSFRFWHKHVRCLMIRFMSAGLHQLMLSLNSRKKLSLGSYLARSRYLIHQ